MQHHVWGRGQAKSTTRNPVFRWPRSSDPAGIASVLPRSQVPRRRWLGPANSPYRQAPAGFPDSVPASVRVVPNANSIRVCAVYAASCLWVSTSCRTLCWFSALPSRHSSCCSGPCPRSSWKTWLSWILSTSLTTISRATLLWNERASGARRLRKLRRTTRELARRLAFVLANHSVAKQKIARLRSPRRTLRMSHCHAFQISAAVRINSAAIRSIALSLSTGGMHNRLLRSMRSSSTGSVPLPYV